MKVKFIADYGFVGGKREYIEEVPDDISGEKLDEMAWEYATEYVSSDWQRVEE